MNKRVNAIRGITQQLDSRNMILCLGARLRRRRHPHQLVELVGSQGAASSIGFSA